MGLQRGPGHTLEREDLRGLRGLGAEDFRGLQRTWTHTQPAEDLDTHSTCVRGLGHTLNLHFRSPSSSSPLRRQGAPITACQVSASCGADDQFRSSEPGMGYPRALIVDSSSSGFYSLHQPMSPPGFALRGRDRLRVCVHDRLSARSATRSAIHDRLLCESE